MLCLVDDDTRCGIIESVPGGEKLFDSMKANSKADWTPDNVKTVARTYGLTVRQRGTSHAVLTNASGQHLTIPMHKPIKPIYIKRLVALIEAAQ